MQVHTLDLLYLGFEHAIAAYLVEGEEGWLLIETGPMITLPTLREKLRDFGLQSQDIRHVLVTHIHLDHAGGAGWWAQQGATVYVHHVGAPHIVDPARLWKSAGRIYGEDNMKRLWGDMTPAPADFVQPLYDNDVVRAAGLEIIARDTPGHAWHHHTYQVGRSAFAGDVAGVRLQPHAWISLPAPPPEFDLEAWRGSIDRLRGLDLETLYLTHFGAVEDPGPHLQQLAGTLEESAAFIRSKLEEGLQRDALMADYRQWNRARAEQARTDGYAFNGRYEAANPLFMSVDGITRYWQKRLATS